MQSTARALGALIVGAILLLPLAAAAADTAPPTTAPVSGVKVKEPQPQVTQPNVSSPPVAGKGSTAVPGWNNPPSWESVSERPQYASIPGRETDRLIQAEGRQWREFRNGPVTLYAGWLIGFTFLAIVAFYLIIGPMKVHAPPTGRLIERFNAVERVTHWAMAISFVALALSGVVILWGKHIILPWLGYAGFSWVLILSKNLHNFLGPLFIFSLAVLFLLFVKDNIFNKVDLVWLSKAGGMLGGPHMPSGRFNGGEKVWFWLSTMILGLLVSVTGLILDFPNWNQAREVMQIANVCHGVGAIIFMCGAMGHTYLGTFGLPGAYGAMAHGYVDESWAKEHHPIWYEEVKEGKRPERILPAGTVPAPGDD